MSSALVYDVYREGGATQTARLPDGRPRIVKVIYLPPRTLGYVSYGPRCAATCMHPPPSQLKRI